MPLDPLQEEVARLALHLAEAGQVALAGGGAMLAHEFVDRPTTDVDLFTPEAGEVGPFTDALSTALRERGYAVDVTRREEAFTHLQVAAPDGRQVAVEVAQDARMLPPVQLAVGAVLHPDELAADKTLALFGRGSARDLVDVDALAGRYGGERLLELAAEKDPGFDPAVFADALSAAAGRSSQAFTDLGVTEAGTARLRQTAAAWRSSLVGDRNSPNVPNSPDGPGRVVRQEQQMDRPATLADVLAALDAQESALGRLEDRVSRLEAAAGGTAGVDAVRQRDTARELDYEQAEQFARERQGEQDRGLER